MREKRREREKERERERERERDTACICLEKQRFFNVFQSAEYQIKFHILVTD